MENLARALRKPDRKEKNVPEREGSPEQAPLLLRSDIAAQFLAQTKTWDQASDEEIRKDYVELVQSKGFPPEYQRVMHGAVGRFIAERAYMKNSLSSVVGAKDFVKRYLNVEVDGFVDMHSEKMPPTIVFQSEQDFKKVLQSLGGTEMQVHGFFAVQTSLLFDGGQRLPIILQRYTRGPEDKRGSEEISKDRALAYSHERQHYLFELFNDMKARDNNLDATSIEQVFQSHARNIIGDVSGNVAQRQENLMTSLLELKTLPTLADELCAYIIERTPLDSDFRDSLMETYIIPAVDSEILRAPFPEGNRFPNEVMSRARERAIERMARIADKAILAALELKKYNLPPEAIVGAFMCEPIQMWGRLVARMKKDGAWNQYIARNSTLP